MNTSTNADSNLRCEYALRVALQTMKERCLALQKRVTTAEEENQLLREQISNSTATIQTSNSVGGSAAEQLQLRLKVAELDRQKAQLTEHINMVSNENRKLWSRLSQMAKEQGKLLTEKDNDCTLTNAEDTADDTSSPRTAAAASQNLIRSKTFTQHSPNPNLRRKLIPCNINGESADVSLDEVALHADEDIADVDGAQMALGYLNVDENATSVASTSDTDFNLEAKNCIEGLWEMRREAMKQQRDLNAALTVLEGRVASQPCPECAQNSKKPEMADKSLETDESLSDANLYKNTQLKQDSVLNGHNLLTESRTPTSHINILQEKIQADALDKTCPMCGKTYNSLVSFDAFREHVEMHFIDDSSDVENSMERNFEFISHAVGDF